MEPEEKGQQSQLKVGSECSPGHSGKLVPPGSQDSENLTEQL